MDGLLESAAAGAMAGQFLQAVLQKKKKYSRFKPVLRQLESTLNDLTPKVNQIEKLNRNFSYSQKGDISGLVVLLEDGMKLVEDCSKARFWNVRKRIRYCERLLELNDSLNSFLLNLQVDNSKDNKEILLELKKLNQKLDRMEID